MPVTYKTGSGKAVRPERLREFSLQFPASSHHECLICALSCAELRADGSVRAAAAPGSAVFGGVQLVGVGNFVCYI